MKIVFFLLISLIASIASFCQAKISKTFYPNGKTESITHKESPELTRIETFYKNGKLKSEVNLKQGKTFGWQREFDSTGKRIQERFILGLDMVPHNMLFNTADSSFNDHLVDAITGKEINYFQNGRKESEGYIVHGIRIGLWHYFNEDGTFKESVFHREMKLEQITK